MKFLFLSLLLFPLFCFSQKYELIPLNSVANTSLRGLSVVTDQIAWASGSNGYIGKTVDGGLHWKWMQPNGYEKLDFRDIEAFDDLNAIVVNAGSPAFVLQTTDGGKTWEETYKNLDSAIFLDGMDFWDEKNGIVFGDPIHDKMQLLKTDDGGATWRNISNCLKRKMKVGEAGFAASGTSIKTLDSGKVWIATGGSVSNVYFSDNYGLKWKRYKCPIWQGESSTGAFSIDFYDENNGIVVGGNYLKDKDNPNNVLLTDNGGKKWHKPQWPVSGYRSAVAYITDKVCIATGTSGIDASNDGGQNWYHISDLDFNVVQKAKKGNLVLMAGNKGVIYSLKTE